MQPRAENTYIYSVYIYIISIHIFPLCVCVYVQGVWGVVRWANNVQYGWRTNVIQRYSATGCSLLLTHVSGTTLKMSYVVQGWGSGEVLKIVPRDCFRKPVARSFGA